MFSLEASRRYFMCQHPVNMRKGIDSLFNLIQAESPLSPMSGDVFVFFSKNRQSVKLLRWDTDGFLLYQKRLERGSFEMPRINPSTGYYELSWETFSFIMSGVSLESTIAKLEALLQERDASLTKAQNQMRGLSKLIEKKSEQQKPQTAAPKTEEEKEAEEARKHTKKYVSTK